MAHLLKINPLVLAATGWMLSIAPTFGQRTVAKPEQPSPSRDGNIDGLWRSQTDAVYKFIQRGKRIVAIYEKPNEKQRQSGINEGDLALKGDLIGNILIATYYQKAPLAVQDICPEFKIIDGNIAWELDSAGNSLTGALLIVGGSDDSCEITTRTFQQMRLERTK